jgi:hypothetical protein
VTNLITLDQHNDELDQSSGMDEDNTQEYDETLLLRSIFNIPSSFSILCFSFIRYE